MLPDDELMHEGVSIRDGAPGRGSGRYPLGSGEHPYQGLDHGFLGIVKELKKQGMTETEIAKALGLKSTSELRADKTIARENQRRIDMEAAIAMRDEGLGASEIARRMSDPSHPSSYKTWRESTIRSLLDSDRAMRTDRTRECANALKEYVDQGKYIDIGPGTEFELGVSSTKLKTAVAMLEKEGYHKYYLKVQQLGTGKETTLTVLCQPDVEYKEMIANQDRIEAINVVRKDVDGMTVLGMPPMKEIVKSSIDPSRIKVVYDEQGGTLMDGVVQIRRGVDDLSLGANTYAQVRIPVDGTHYIKGMAIYGEDKIFPPGVDLVVNSNKKEGTPLLVKGDKNAPQVLKPMKLDQDNPYGSSIKREEELKYASKYYLDKNGKKQLSAINIVSEEGTWEGWSKSLASQFLSKQPIKLAQKQLDLDVMDKKAEYDSIQQVTNPTVKKILMEKFADKCDKAADDLKGAALPGQTTKVLLPLKSISDREVYAPDLQNGQQVALVRYPHQGRFEIPILTVNNNNREGKSVIGNSIDAIGIAHPTAEKLSGADFDGDSAICIPITNKKGEKTVNIISEKTPKDLIGFNPKIYYKEGFNVKNQTKQTNMGIATNLLADMTMIGAPIDHIVRATKYAQVVIDSEKHHLDYRQAYKDFNIGELKKLYQNGGGAGTIITKAGADLRVGKRKEAYKPDPKTGKKIYIETPESYVDKKTGKTVVKTSKTTPMREADDARDLMSSKEGYPMERVYANYANQMKALANQTRKDTFMIDEIKRNPSAAKAYAEEVSLLKSKLNNALRNAPKERMAQLTANLIVRAKKAENPDMTKEEYKKIKGQALGQARANVGAKKEKVTFSPKEWEAIQAGAIGSTSLKKLIANADLDSVKKLAMPQNDRGITASQIALIKARVGAGFTLDEVAKMIGVSASTVRRYAK